MDHADQHIESFFCRQSTDSANHESIRRKSCSPLGSAGIDPTREFVRVDRVFNEMTAIGSDTTGERSIVQIFADTDHRFVTWQTDAINRIVKWRATRLFHPAMYGGDKPHWPESAQ